MSKHVETELRLKEWGAWLVKIMEGGIGYPSQATLVTALQGSRSTAIRHIPDNPRAEEIDAIYNHLLAIYPLRAKIMKAHYTSKEHPRENAYKYALPLRQYYQLLLLARTFVEAKLC